MSWFDVDKSGLASLLEARGKSFAIFELLANAWDADATEVSITLAPCEGVPQARLIVQDNSPNGFVNLADAFTMFARSRRSGDPTKAGRFCLGEKLVLSLCSRAEIISTTGGIRFDSEGRRTIREKRDAGTYFDATIRMTRDELAEVSERIMRVIPRVPTTFNGSPLEPPAQLKTFTAKLPTVIADAEGNLRPSVRQTTIQAYASDDGGEILELGIPVCKADWPWRLNVMQKVPLGMDRDSVTDGFRRALQVAAMNAMADTITESDSTQPWASEAIGDSRIAPAALKQVVVKRFGERAVIAVPGEPIANATAEAMGCTVVHGGALSGDAWANIRKHEMIPSTSAAFPTPRPANKGAAPEMCPLCKRPINA